MNKSTINVPSAGTETESSTNAQDEQVSQPIAKHGVGRSSSRQIIYIYANAFTTCDCGKEIMLSVRRYGSDLYEGSCNCGKNYQMFLNKLMEVE